MKDIITPSTKHMTAEERQAGNQQMLADLNQLAKNDGCIAAAWALEVIESLGNQGSCGVKRRVKVIECDASDVAFQDMVNNALENLEARGKQVVDIQTHYQPSKMAAIGDVAYHTVTYVAVIVYTEVSAS